MCVVLTLLYHFFTFPKRPTPTREAGTPGEESEEGKANGGSWGGAHRGLAREPQRGRLCARARVGGRQLARTPLHSALFSPLAQPPPTPPTPQVQDDSGWDGGNPKASSESEVLEDPGFVGEQEEGKEVKGKNLKPPLAGFPPKSERDADAAALGGPEGRRPGKRNARDPEGRGGAGGGACCHSLETPPLGPTSRLAIGGLRGRVRGTPPSRHRPPPRPLPAYAFGPSRSL